MSWIFFDHRGAAERLQRLRRRDLILHPRRVLEDTRATGEFACRLQNRWVETIFFSDDSRRNRLARDGFFDGVAAVRSGRLHAGPAHTPVVLKLEFALREGEDVAARTHQLSQIVRDVKAMLEQGVLSE